MLNLASVTSIFLFVFKIALCPRVPCNHGLTVINVIGAASAPFSDASVAVYCHFVLSAVGLWCCAVVGALLGFKVPRAGSGGRWPAVSSFVAVCATPIPTACRDSWPCFFPLLLRVECAASPSKRQMPAPFKKSYTLCVTPAKPYCSTAVKIKPRLSGCSGFCAESF